VPRLHAAPRRDAGARARAARRGLPRRRHRLHRLQEGLVGHLNESLAPLRRRREELAADPGLVERILAEGTERARAEAARVMAAVRRAVRL
jgi:CRISPR/Cas system Type II protein with McrA/HNH and RuvC-like nuclease domain